MGLGRSLAPFPQPTAPSMSSRRMSAWPACRWVSAITRTRRWCSVVPPSFGHHGTWPTVSSASAANLLSACSQARW
ncbi:hypothetical protein SHIRM173S_12432 [Streptomyces hirsutus]